jgi:hypothetical protein
LRLGERAFLAALSWPLRSAPCPLLQACLGLRRYVGVLMNPSRLAYTPDRSTLRIEKPTLLTSRVQYFLLFNVPPFYYDMHMNAQGGYLLFGYRLADRSGYTQMFSFESTLKRCFPRCGSRKLNFRQFRTTVFLCREVLSIETRSYDYIPWFLLTLRSASLAATADAFFSATGCL